MSEMTMKTLGKIESVKFGMGGYDDAMFGVSFSLGNESSSCGDFWGAWTDLPYNAKWTLEARDKHFAQIMSRLLDLMKKAKVFNLNDLVNTPIEIEWENMKLKSWRVLEEVI